MANDDVNIGILVHQEGAALVQQLVKDLSAMRQSLFSLTTAARANAQASQSQLRAQQNILGAIRSSTSAQQSATSAVTSHTNALGGLAKNILAAALAFAGFQGFKSFIREGLEFNQTIETAGLGIASLITSQAQLHDAQGTLLTGTVALGAAQKLAADQVQKLRIAGLQTTATTQELVVAFQQAVGVGLRWGLTLDQTRKIAIQMSQAAGALGLPMNQLNEEIRDFLGGNISARNTRIATALGITNEQVREAQNAGKLFDFVSGKLQAFSTAGEATAKTFSGVMSNVKEAMQNLAGDATAPLFDRLKVSGQAALEEVFDLKNARISSKFDGIIEVAQKTFGALGDLLAEALGGALENAIEFSAWLKESHFEIDQIFKTTGVLGQTLADLARDIGNITVGLTAAGVQGGFWKTVLTGVGIVIAGIHTGFQGILLILSHLGEGILTLLVKPFTFFLKIAAGAAGLFDETLAASIRSTAKEGDDFINSITEANNAYNDSLANNGTALDVFLGRIKDADAAAIRSEQHMQALRRAAATTPVAPTPPLASLTPNTSGNKEKISPSKAEQALTLTAKAELANRLKDLKIALDNQLLSYKQYYDAVTKAQQEAIDKEIAAQRIRLAGTSGVDARNKVLAQIKVLEGQRLQVVEDNAEKRRQAELKLAEEVTAANVTLLKDEGRIADARALEIGDKFKLLVAKLKAEGNTAGIEIVTNLFNIDNAKARLEELVRSSKTVTDTLATELDAINTESTAHAITENEAREKIVTAYRKAREQLVLMVPLMEAFAKATKDPAAIQAVEDLKVKLAQMGVTIQQTADELHKLKEGARDAFTSGLSQFLNDAATGAKDLGTSFRDAARSIIDSLRQIASQMLANLIIQESLKFFGFSGGGPVAVKKAAGGYISGVGGPTSDSIPAWLSNGEYVVRASAVDTVGRDFLDSINQAGTPALRTRRRARGYADGGLVRPEVGPGGSSHSLSVGLEDGLVARHLESSEGQRAMIKFIEKNSTKIKRAMGQR